MRRFILSTLTILSGVIAVAQNQQNTLPTSGNVGIGTTAPNCKLEVVGEAHVKGRTIVDSALYVKDSARFERDARIDGNLNVAGDVLFNQDLDVNGTIRNPSISDPSGLNFVGVKPNGELRGLNANELLNNMYSPIGGCYPIMDVDGQIVGGLAPAWRSVPGGGPVANPEPGILYTGVPCGARVGINIDNPAAMLAVKAKPGLTYPIMQGLDPNSNVAFVIDTSGATGIGIGTPMADLHIQSDGNLNPLLITDGVNNLLSISRTGATSLGANDDQNYAMHIRNADDIGKGLLIEAGGGDNAAGEYAVLNVTRINGGPHGGGITELFKVNGQSGITYAREITVDLNVNWPDYVFEKGYELMSIDSVAEFIGAHGHLPGIPSAEEMEAKGVNVAENDAMFMEKLEEMMLYIIELKQENNELRKEIEALKVQE